MEITLITSPLQFFNFIALLLMVFLTQDIQNAKLNFLLFLAHNQQGALKFEEMEIYQYTILILAQLNLNLPKVTILLVMS
ncbi:hypothetical protein HMPREF1548_00744 [Clostridium sp. KLE 1755]|nr:hypothetical protein HMPREF1548_00744 [Clostridium sp. KLE 1755]